MTGIALIVMPHLLRLMNTPDDIFQDAMTYINIVVLGTIAIAFYNLFAAFLRAFFAAACTVHILNHLLQFSPNGHLYYIPPWGICQ